MSLHFKAVPDGTSLGLAAVSALRRPSFVVDAAGVSDAENNAFATWVQASEKVAVRWM